MSTEEFMQATLVERAISLLRGSFRDPREAVSRVNVAMALANNLDGAQRAGLIGAPREVRADVLRSVSEAWQLLISARLICPDLAQHQGDWWLLTDVGVLVRDSDDPEGEIRLRLSGGL